MASIRCLKCGKSNKDENDVCENCGEKLQKGPEYEAKLQELRDYEAFKRRYSISGTIIAILLLLLLWPLLNWLIPFMLSMFEVEGAIPQDMLKWVAPVSTLITLLVAIPPMIYRRRKIGRKYQWTADRMQSLDGEIKSLPRDFFGTATPAASEAKSATRRGSPLSALIAIACIALVVFCMEKYTDYKPITLITSLLETDSGHTNTGSTATVSGRYECHYSQKDMGGGAARVDQTWAYVFRSNGTYTTYVNGSQQYSGTWSQSGRTLTIKVPALPGGGPAKTGTATVARDASSFTISTGEKYVRIK